MLFILKYWIVLISSVIFLVGSLKFRCDYMYNTMGWFKYHKIPATFFDARLRCKLEGGVLASPSTAELRNIMKQSIGTVDVFTGIHATFSKGHYHSVDGIPLDAMPHAWADGEPDNKNNAESCLAMNNKGYLSDVKCGKPRPFICYREKSNIDVTICGTPDPDYHFESTTNKCYKFHTRPRTFERAFFACASEGGHLAIINSEEESKVIRDVFNRYPGVSLRGNFWKDVAFIGFHNWGEGADWTTIHGESIEDAGFARFLGGEPNNSTDGQYCGSVYRNGLLNDLWCEKHYAFICEKSGTFPPVCNTESFFDPPLQTDQVQDSN